MADKNMAYSLIFKVIDGASAVVRGIANVMGEPAEAAGKWADAVEKSGERQVSAFRKMKDALGEVAESVTRPIMRMAELGKVAAEASEKFSRSFAGIGAIAAEGFSIKNVAQQEEFFRRLQINTGMSTAAIKELREQINNASDAYGVNHDRLMEAFGAFRANGGDIKTFGENAKTAAATLQLTGVEAENAGQLFAFLSTKMQLKSPEEFVSTLAMMRQQLKGIPDGMDAFAEASMRLSASMQALHLNGAQGALALNAVYAVAARSSGGGGRRAMAATETWLSQLADRGYQAQLSQGLGERITDANGYVMDPRVIMQKMAARYAAVGKLPANQQVVATQRLDALFGEAAARMFKSVGGEIKATGHSATIEKVLGAKSDGTEFMDKAQQASEGLSGSMNRLRTAMDRASEALFAGPVDKLAAALNHCTGIVAGLVITLASFIAVGQGIKWIVGAYEGFSLLVAVIPGASTALSLLAGIVPAVLSGIGALTIGIVQMSLAMLASPITWIVAGIALIGVGIYELATHWKAIWGAMPAPVQKVWTFIADGFDWLSKKLGINWSAIGDAISGVIKSIKTWAEPVLDWFSDKLGKIFGVISSGADWVKDKLGLGGGASDTPENGAAPPAANDNSGFHLFGNGGLLAPITNLMTGSGAPSTDQMAAYFRSKGWSANAAAGIAANLFKESRNNAGAVGDHGQAYGLAQWHADRQAEFARVYGRSMRGSSWQQQADFVDHELHNRESRAGNALRSAASAEQAGAIMSSLYERPANTRGEAMQRAQIAARIAGSRGAGAAPSMGATDQPAVTVPTNIYGPTGAVVGQNFADALPMAGGGPRGPWARLTIEIKDGKNHVRTHLDHSSDMEASLDRGKPMVVGWG